MVGISGETSHHVEIMSALCVEVECKCVLARQCVLAPVGSVGLAAFALHLAGECARIVTECLSVVSVIWVLAAEFEVREYSHIESDGMVHRPALQIVGIKVDCRTRSIDFLSVVPQGVEVVVGFDKRTEVYGRLIICRAADWSEIHILVAVGISAFVAYFNPFGEFVFEAEASGKALHTALFDDTLGVIVAYRAVVAGLGAASGDWEGIILSRDSAGDFLHPVGAGSEWERVGIGIFAKRSAVAYRIIAVGSVEIGIVVAVLGEFRRIHYVEAFGELRETDIGF